MQIFTTEFNPFLKHRGTEDTERKNEKDILSFLLHLSVLSVPLCFKKGLSPYTPFVAFFAAAIKFCHSCCPETICNSIFNHIAGSAKRNESVNLTLSFSVQTNISAP